MNKFIVGNLRDVEKVSRINDLIKNTKKIGNIHFDQRILDFLNVDCVDEFCKNIKTLKFIGRSPDTYDSIFEIFNGEDSIYVIFYNDFNLFYYYNKNYTALKVYNEDEYQLLIKEKDEIFHKEQSIILDNINLIQGGCTIDNDIFIKFRDKIISYYNNIKIHDDIDIEKNNIEKFLSMDILEI